MGDSKREFFPSPGESTCPRKLSVPHRVQGYRITDPVALPFRGHPFVAPAWACHLIKFPGSCLYKGGDSGQSSYIVTPFVNG